MRQTGDRPMDNVRPWASYSVLHQAGSVRSVPDHRRSLLHHRIFYHWIGPRRRRGNKRVLLGYLPHSFLAHSSSDKDAPTSLTARREELAHSISRACTTSTSPLNERNKAGKRQPQVDLIDGHTIVLGTDPKMTTEVHVDHRSGRHTNCLFDIRPVLDGGQRRQRIYRRRETGAILAVLRLARFQKPALNSKFPATYVRLNVSPSLTRAREEV